MMVKLPPHTRTEITAEFFINYKPALQNMEDLLKLNLETIVSVLGILPMKPTLARFFERIHKIQAVTVFPTLVMLLLRHPLPDLT